MKSLSRYEKCWAFAHPFAAFKIRKYQVEMYETYKEVKNQKLLDTFENGGKLDAFRHTFAMAYFSKFVRVKKLRKLGKAHERANRQQFLHRQADEAGELPDSLSSVMDLLNNEIAFSMAGEVKDLAKADIKQKVIDMINSGKVFIMKRNEKGQYMSCDNKIIGEEELKGKWNIPKCIVKSNE